MNYRKNPKNGDMLSALGYGCMRFTKKGTSIDQSKAESEMITAIENGVNYFDTAYIYSGSEVALGKLLAKGYRDKIFLATKLPHYLIKTSQDIEKYFSAQLNRLQTDYIDYYLIHMLSDINVWERLKSIGIEDWIKEKKSSGQIRNIGFSFHGGTTSFITLIDAYDWDFTQIQYNYLDEYSQAGITGLKYASSKSLPVIIMEPLRGGKLANLPKTAEKIMKDAPVQRSAAEWGLRWVLNHSEVTVVLSGMNSLAQVKENVRVASEIKPGTMSTEALMLIEKVKKILTAKTKVPCTGCSYCMPCPQGVDIPVCFKAYNDVYSDSWFTGMKEYFMCTTLKPDPSNASKCIQCGRCEQHCPQKIEIIKELQNVKKKMESPAYRLARFAIKKRF
jgi:hypothetical protein